MEVVLALYNRYQLFYSCFTITGAFIAFGSSTPHDVCPLPTLSTTVGSIVPLCRVVENRGVESRGGEWVCGTSHFHAV